MAQDIHVVTGSRLLTAEQFQRLADVPPEAQWFSNPRGSLLFMGLIAIILVAPLLISSYMSALKSPRPSAPVESK